MSGELVVDYEVIAGLADRLQAAASGLGSWGSAIPPLPVAGIGSVQTGAMTAHVLREIAHLTLALDSAADALNATKRSYADADELSRVRNASLMGSR